MVWGSKTQYFLLYCIQWLVEGTSLSIQLCLEKTLALNQQSGLKAQK